MNTSADFCRMRGVGAENGERDPSRSSSRPLSSQEQLAPADSHRRSLFAECEEPAFLEFFEHPERLTADPTAQKKIRFVARRFLRIYDWYPDSLEDVEQECWLALWKQFRNFDPQRASWGTFVRRLAVSQCKDLRKFHRRKKRRATKRLWLEDRVPPGDEGEELSVEEVLSEEVHHRRFGRRFLTQYDQADLQDAIDWLPVNLGRLAMLLQVHNYREIRKKLALTRSELRDGLTGLGILLRQGGIEPSSLLA